MYSVDEIAAIVGGRVLRADRATPHRIVHDSREVGEGDLFVALRGRRTDGHAFLRDAFSNGACAALVSDPAAAPETGRNFIVVADPQDALLRLASAWRGTLDATCVGVTGSNGKTTTRALLAHLLRSSRDAREVYSAARNYNTEVGLPLALLATPRTASVALFELGTERPGDIALLADLLAPDVGVVTSVGPSHLSGFGSIDAVATEKWSLIERMPEHGWAAINADSPHLRRLADGWAGDLLTVGLNDGSIRGRIEQEVPWLQVALDDPPMRLRCPLVGAHHATNVLLAAAIALRLGARADEVERHIPTFRPIPHRLNPTSAPFGTVLDDTYNANPVSTEGALRVLAQLGGRSVRRVFIYGEMRDLGADADRYHHEILDLALRLGIDAILPVGDGAIAACRARVAPAVRIVARGELAGAIDALAHEGTELIVLVKGSRALALDRLVDELVPDPA